MCRTCKNDNTREGQRIVRAAAASLGLTQKEYARIYGQSKYVATRVLGGEG